MKDRIVKFIESENLSPAEFADKIGVQRSSVSHVLNGRNNPGFAFIQKILEAFPSINSRWLLTGDGSIYESDMPTNKKEKPKPNDLFSTESPSIPEQTTTKKEPLKTVVKTENTADPIQNSSIPPELPIKQTEKKITKVLIFYDDHTFEDFRPAE